MISFLTNNLIILSVFFSFIISQITKLLIFSIKRKKYAFKVLYREYGGMPSTHTAVVSGLVFAVYFLEGFSNLFWVSLVFSFIIIGDVMDSKWFYEKRDNILNKLIRKHKKYNKNNLKEIEGEFGHTFLEVVVGVLIGLCVNLILFFI